MRRAAVLIRHPGGRLHAPCSLAETLRVVGDVA